MIKGKGLGMDLGWLLAGHAHSSGFCTWHQCGINWALCCIPGISIPRGLNQEDQKFLVILGYIVEFEASQSYVRLSSKQND